MRSALPEAFLVGPETLQAYLSPNLQALLLKLTGMYMFCKNALLYISINQTFLHLNGWIFKSGLQQKVRQPLVTYYTYQPTRTSLAESQNHRSSEQEKTSGSSPIHTWSRIFSKTYLTSGHLVFVWRHPGVFKGTYLLLRQPILLLHYPHC